MDNNANLINKYIEKLNNELCEATKKRIVLEAQIETQAEEFEQRERDQIHTFETALREMSEKITKMESDHTTEVEVIKGQRKELQKECNELRTQMSEQKQQFEAYVASLNEAKVAEIPKKRLRTAK